MAELVRVREESEEVREQAKIQQGQTEQVVRAMLESLKMEHEQAMHAAKEEWNDKLRTQETEQRTQKENEEKLRVQWQEAKREIERLHLIMQERTSEEKDGFLETLSQEKAQLEKQ